MSDFIWVSCTLASFVIGYSIGLKRGTKRTLMLIVALVKSKTLSRLDEIEIKED